MKKCTIKPVIKTIKEEKIITYLNDSLLSIKVEIFISEERKKEKIMTPTVPNDAATKPLPPSRRPKACP